MSLKEEKESIRKSIYDKLFHEGQSLRPNGDYGKIPDFKGSDIAAELLASTDEWKSSKTIFCSPDSAQIPVRYLALKDNKNLIMASPNLEHGYLYLEGSKLNGNEKEASTKEGAFNHCDKFFDFGDGSSFDMAIDLVVEGSVGVDRFGNRIGKGKGFADSLSASATGKPILLVGKELTEEQKQIFAGGAAVFLVDFGHAIGHTTGQEHQNESPTGAA